MAENTGQAPKLTGAFELFNVSSKLVQNNLSTFAIVYLLPFLTSLAIGVRNLDSNRPEDFSSISNTFSGVSGFGVGAFIGFGALLAIVVFVVWLVVNALKYGLLIESSKNKKPQLDNLWPYARKYWLRLFGLAILVALFVIAGLILFIIPGLIMIRRYFLAPYVLVDKDVGIWEAMSKSAAMSKPYSGYIWSVIGVGILIGLPSIIPFFGWAVSFVLSILYSVAPALRYQELKKLEA
ncbi:MAG TPA: hypothetical protein VLE69_03545 [Candidatus Saccharimonadales bacterium]|nr:hypothetical protein [Candidatus Saccharimonadales bacterium]